MANTIKIGVTLPTLGQAALETLLGRAFALVDGVLSLSIVDDTLTSPPTATGGGDCYIVASSATGDWSGHDGEVALDLPPNDAEEWTFVAPFEGLVAYFQGDGLKVYDGASWADVGGSGAGTGDVTGPASSADGNIPTFNGTTGKDLEDSGVGISSVVTLSGTQTLTNKTLTTPTIDSIKGSLGAVIVQVQNPASVVNSAVIRGGATGVDVRISAAGTDTDVNLTLRPQGSGVVKVGKGGVDREVVTVAGAQTLADKTLTAPTVDDFTNSPHSHADVAGGGTLDASAIGSGIIGHARLGTGGGGSSKFLREDSTYQTIAAGGDALTSGNLGQFAATSSAQLAGVISDETGSGALVFAISPSLTTPNIGTPSGGVLTNCTGYPQGTTTAQGALELATVAEAVAGVDTARAVTPEGLLAAITALSPGISLGRSLALSRGAALQ